MGQHPQKRLALKLDKSVYKGKTKYQLIGSNMIGNEKYLFTIPCTPSGTPVKFWPVDDQKTGKKVQIAFGNITKLTEGGEYIKSKKNENF